MAESSPLHGDSLRQPADEQPASHNRTITEVNASVMPYLEKLFNSHASPEKTWHRDQIISFLHHRQADKVTDDSGHITTKDELDLSGFLQYMTSSTTDVQAPLSESDLSYPLSSYYISSSHNTYLTGNQLNSDSDAEAYKNVLLQGCRCVEIDVWNGDDSDSESDSSDSDDEPAKEKKRAKKLSRRERIASKLPSSLATRLGKTSLGSKLTSEKDGKPTEAAQEGSHDTATDETQPLEKAPSPRAVAVEPRVLHGYTLTKEVSFRDVCEAIRDYAFVVSDLPVIVSLEVHCNSEQQEIMVRIMNETWAEYLLSPPSKDAQYLPTPDELRRKILVKVKYAPPGTSVPNDDDMASSDSLPPDAPAKPKKPSKITQALSGLGVYTRGVSFKSLAQPEASMPTHIFSLSEGTVEEVHDKNAPQLFEHNRHYMMRTYPSGMRIQSSNLDPPVFWRKGIQIVALNWQKWDEGMMLNEGMFSGTGGYVLKPDGYRGKKTIIADAAAATSTTEATPTPIIHAPTDAAAEPVIMHHILDLKITVYAAQDLPLPHKDTKVSSFKPYVKVEMHMEPPHTLLANVKREDTHAKEGEYKAHTRSQRGVHPDFKGEVLAFDHVSGVVPELTFVRFLVKDDEIGRDDLAAWACVRLDRLRSGYRFVRLMTMKGAVSPGVVFVKVEKTLK
ncbi:phosphatidylinositol-specific phospholipase C [Astrocystis sublimbata]|nr:phosphatidylinositol-specific phospholipase C [Astrocystis sublimbata]